MKSIKKSADFLAVGGIIVIVVGLFVLIYETHTQDFVPEGVKFWGLWVLIMVGIGISAIGLVLDLSFNKKNNGEEHE